MAIVSKVFFDGVIPTTKGTLYTVPASADDMPTFASFYNSNAAGQTVLVYVNATGTSRVIGRFGLGQNETAKMRLPPLEAGDLVEAETTTASAVTCVISGAERT